MWNFNLYVKCKVMNLMRRMMGQTGLRLSKFKWQVYTQVYMYFIIQVPLPIIHLMVITLITFDILDLNLTHTWKLYLPCLKIDWWVLQCSHQWLWLPLKRPDITIYFTAEKKCVVIELTVPAEENIAQANYRKKCKYTDLIQECREAGWEVKYFPIEVGSRGFRFTNQT